MGRKYNSFKDEEQIINKLRKDRNNIENLFTKKLTLREIINTAIGSNTYRVFKSNGGISPSKMFKDWANSMLGQEADIKSKLCVESKEEFDIFFEFLCNDLLEKWNKELNGMTVFRSRKIISLLLRNFCFWEKFDNIELKNYIEKITIPLDSRTLSAIRLPYNRIGKYRIPVNVTMGFIDKEDKYIEFQKYFQYLANKAEVPVIYLDYLYNSEI